MHLRSGIVCMGRSERGRSGEVVVVWEARGKGSIGCEAVHHCQTSVLFEEWWRGGGVVQFILVESF